jgi:hypothetical protein
MRLQSNSEAQARFLSHRLAALKGQNGIKPSTCELNDIARAPDILTSPPDHTQLNR